MSITFNGERIRRPVKGVSCLEKEWDAKKQRIRTSKNDPFNENGSFNNRLDFIQTQVKLIKQSAFDRREKLTEKFIIDRLENHDLIKADNYDFFTIAEEYLKSIKPVKAERTITGKITAFNFLKDYEIHKNEVLTFGSMNIEFFESFRSYCFNVKQIQDNYFAKIISVLKAFLNWGFEHGYIKDQTFRRFKAPEKETEVICLTLEELLALKNYEFKSKRLEHVRDIFVFGCSTGLRFSDIITLQEENVTEEFIHKTIQKTREIATIPLNRISKEILTKYSKTVYSPLPKVSIQKFNKYLKECCEKAGINSPVVITRFSGGKRIEYKFEKHELITSHVARKTFTTLSLILGVPERVVKGITGHKKEENFKKYVNFSKKFEHVKINEAWNLI